MISRSHWFAVLAVLLLTSSAAPAQQAVVPADLSGSRPVPSTVRFAGTLPAGGGTVLVFALYEEAVGGEPIWEEAQEVSADGSGRYAVLLGASRGGLLAAFADGAPRWLGVRPAGGPEQPRVCLVSVPYALKAADADTIAGRPVSSFVLAGDRTGIGPDGLTYVDTRVLSAGLATGGTGAPGGAGTANYIGMFTDPTTLGNSVIYQTPSGSVGLNTLAPNAAFHVAAAAAPAMYVDVFNNSLGALPLVYRAARGTPAAPSAVQANDILGGLAVRGYGATTFSAGRGQVMFKAAENWTDEANGTYLQFTTTPIGSGAWAERMRIDPAGNVGIGTAVPMQKLTVAGTVESTAGGFRFPDGTTQATASVAYTAGAGLALSSNAFSVNFDGTGGAASASRSDHNHDATYVNAAGDTVTGTLTLNSPLSCTGCIGATNLSGSLRRGFAAHMTANQSVPYNSWQTVAFSGEDYDAQGDYNPATATFTVPEAGFYHFTCSFLLTGAVDSNNVRLSVGGEQLQRYGPIPPYDHLTINIDRFFGAGSTVACNFYNLVAGGLTISSSMSRFSGFRVH
jgi:hypothetical protein